jgi:hypothetical protein
MALLAAAVPVALVARLSVKAAEVRVLLEERLVMAVQAVQAAQGVLLSK